VKVAELTTVTPAAVTLIFPVVAPVGTVAVMLVEDTTVNVTAAVVLNFTGVAPVKLVPVIVTVAPTAPDVGVKLVIVGAATTVKDAELVPVPPDVVTLIFPVVAPVGTVAVILVEETTVNVMAAVVLNFTAVAPVKFVPVIVAIAPTAPDVGEKLVTVGAAAKAVGPQEKQSAVSNKRRTRTSTCGRTIEERSRTQKMLRSMRGEKCGNGGDL